MSQSDSYRKNAYAVVIGINEYEDPRIPNLTFARADAEEVYRILTDPTLGRFSPKNVTLLLDSDATERRIRTAIGRDVRRQAGREGFVCIYYAGHGSAEIDPKCQYQDGLEKYLIPSDAELDNLFSTGIAMEDIQKFFLRIDAGQIIFFIDSCYSGEAGGRTFRNPNFQKRAAMSAEFLDGMSGEGRLVVTACDVNEVSLETNEAGHGLFTYHLIEGLKGAADKDQDGLVTSDELYAYVFEKVSDHARRLGGSMNPIQKGFLKGKVFLTQYETEAQKKAAKLHAQALSLVKREEYEKAYLLWKRVIEFVPGHEEAQKGLTAVRMIQEKQERRRQEILEKEQSKLLSLYYKSRLSADELNFAVELIKKTDKDLTEAEQRIHRLIKELVAEKISPEVYLDCVNLVRRETGPEVKKEEAVPKIDSKKVKARTRDEFAPPPEVSEQERSVEIGEMVQDTPVPSPPAPGIQPQVGAEAEAGYVPAEREEAAATEEEIADSASLREDEEKPAATREPGEEAEESVQAISEAESDKVLHAKWIELPAIVALWFVLGWMMLSVILRYLFNVPLLTSFMPLIIVTIALLSVAITEQSNMHLTMPFAEMFFAGKTRQVLRTIADFIKIATYTVCCILLIDIAAHRKVDIGLVDFSLINWLGPIAFGVMVAYSIVHIIRRRRITKKEN